MVDVQSARMTDAPLARTRTGYGKRLPTALQVQLTASGRWHRVYVACFSNSGTPYIRVKGSERWIAGPDYSLIVEIASRSEK